MVKKALECFVWSVAVVLIAAPPLSEAQRLSREYLEQLVPNEDRYMASVRDSFLTIQNLHFQKTGQRLRGTHAKGVCLRGQFEVLPSSQHDLTPSRTNLAVGVFARPGQYPAFIRFANADGKIQSDQEDDVRAVSISVQMPPDISNPQGRMDFSMNDFPTFAINNIQVFDAVMKIAVDQARRGRGVAMAHALWNFNGLGLKAIFWDARGQKRAPNLAYQKNTYWSGVPFALGQNDAVKYKLSPCRDNSAGPLGRGPNALSEELARHVNNDAQMSCFSFQLQVLDPSRMRLNGAQLAAPEWIENATYEWPEAVTQSPPATVARLTFEPKSMVPAEQCDRFRFDTIGNSNPDHVGLGSINRGRRAAEAGSAEWRLAPQ